MGVFISVAKIILSVVSVVATIIEILTIVAVVKTIIILWDIINTIMVVTQAIIAITSGLLSAGITKAVKSIVYITSKVTEVWTDTLVYINNVWDKLKEGYNKFFRMAKRR